MPRLFSSPDEWWGQYLHTSLDPLTPLSYSPHWNEWVDFIRLSESFISLCFALIMEMSDSNDSSSPVVNFLMWRYWWAVIRLIYPRDYMWPIFFFHIDGLSVWWTKCQSVWMFFYHTPPFSLINFVVYCCLLILCPLNYSSRFILVSSRAISPHNSSYVLADFELHLHHSLPCITEPWRMSLKSWV